jgi:2-polyprenyl-3-methyl-5-hydroxy-6-metoxy-1,4-benzoquinol methylase
MTVAMNQTIDEAKLHTFLGQVVGDLAGYSGALMGYIGDRLGLYRAIVDAGSVTSEELAARTGTAERYIRDWLVNQAAGGYLEYDATSGRYRMAPEQAIALTDESSPAFVGGAFQVMLSIAHSLPRILENVRTGQGMFWGEHHPDLFEGTERFFKPGYVGNLVAAWIPALDGVQAKLEAGASVADVGCGHGATTILMAQAFPASRFVGFDYHEPSIERARQAASEAGVADRIDFQLAESTDFPGRDYDLIAFFDCLHDMADPEAVARRAYATLKPDGTVLLVEPMAGERTEGNFNPVGRIFSAASMLVCTPNAIAGGGTGIGTIATDDDLHRLFTRAGFSRFRRATETPFNRIFEARP